MKTFSALDYFIGVFVSFLSYCVGGYDGMATCVLSLTVVDFITGLCSAIYLGKFSAREMVKGILKKIIIYCSIATAVIIQRFLAMPLREVFIIFYIVYEGTSIFENVGKIVPFPKKIKDVFASLKGE